MSYTIEETAIPAASSKESEPNIFDGRFPTAEGKALTLVVDGKPEAKDNEEVRKITRHARAEAKKVGKSARVKVNDVTVTHDENGKKLPAKDVQRRVAVTVWTVNAITRPRSKGADETAENGQPENVNATGGETVETTDDAATAASAENPNTATA